MLMLAHVAWSLIIDVSRGEIRRELRRPRILPPMGQAVLARGIAIGHTGCEVEFVVDSHVTLDSTLELALLPHSWHISWT